MVKLELTFATKDEALAALLALNGVGSATVTSAKPATTKSKAAEATADAFDTPAEKPAAKAAAKTATKTTKKKAPTVEELKEHVLSLTDDTDAVKQFVASFGVKKISDMDDATRIAAMEQAGVYFAGGEDEAEDEENPMD